MRATGGAPLIGRDHELELVAAARRGGAAGVVLVGEAGAGKTHLCRHVAEDARNGGAHVEWATATRSAASIPFGAVIDLLPVTGPDVSRTDLLARAGEELGARAGGRECVVAVDDAHLLDDASAALLQLLAVRRRAFVVLTVRAGEQVPDSLACLWKDGWVRRVDLGRLTPPAVAELARTDLGGPVDHVACARLVEASEGNALFLRELVAVARERGALVDDDGTWRWTGRGGLVGERLTELVAGRLGSLTDDERRGLETLAVGEPLGLDVAVACCGPAVLDALERRGLARGELDERRVTVSLAHPVYGDAVRAGVPRLRLRAIHRRLAEAVEMTGARRRSDRLRVAVWRLEGDGEASPELLAEAAGDALAVFDHMLGERLARAAHRAGGGSTAGTLLATALYWQGRFDECEHVVAGVLDGDVSGSALVDAAILRSSSQFWGLGDVRGALATLDAAARRADDPALVAELEGHRATILLCHGQVDDAVTTASAVVGDASAAPRARVRAQTAQIAALAVTGRTVEAGALATEVLPVAMALAPSLPLAPGQVLIGQAVAHWLAGRLEQADAIATSLHALAVERRTDETRAPWALALGRVRLAKGQLREAESSLREAAALLRGADTARVLSWCLAALAQALAQQGHAAPAAAALAEAERAFAPAGRLFLGDIEQARVWAAAAAGEISLARRLAADAAARAAVDGQLGLELLARTDLLRLGEAGTQHCRYEVLAKRLDGPLAAAVAMWAAGLAGNDGDGLAKASDDLEAIGARLLAAEAAAQAAGAHRACGRRASAAALAERADALSRGTGARTPALSCARPSPADVLSPREREVAVLAAQGTSSREIAHRLFVSIRTVDNHLARVYAKLDIRGRGDLAGILGLRPRAAS